MELPVDLFRAFANDVRKLCEAVRPRWLFGRGIRITGGGLFTRPVLTDDMVSFNGWPPRLGGYEHFCVMRVYSEKWDGYYRNRRPDEDGLYWDTVKTNQLPYDVVVTAALVSLRHHVAELAFDSDGSRDDWQAGIDLYQRVTQRPPPDDFT
jgi:hypothetical protein